MAMVKNPFNGNLNSNEIFTAIYNMIISQQVFADNIKEGFGLVNKFRTDGSLYGDTKLFYSTDVLETHAWGNDAEASNLLALDRPKDPKCQAITLDTFRQIRLTVDNYLSKRAWGDESAFGNFQSVMLGWIGKTKDVYDNTLINEYVGTIEPSEATVNSRKIVLSAASTIADYEKRGLLIGEGIANLLVELKDYSRDFNGYGFLRNYDPSDFMLVWNANYKNEIRKVDLPTVFHKDGIVDKLDDEMLPAKYFGQAISDITSSTYADATVTTSKPVKNSSGTYTYEPISGNTVILHFAKECDAAVYNTTQSKYIWKHFFAGDLVPEKTAVKGTFTVYSYDRHGNLSTSGTSATIDMKADTYKEDAKIICKLVHKDAIKFMSAFEVASEFWNARSLTENHYLTYGYGLDYLREFPIIKVYESAS